MQDDVLASLIPERGGVGNKTLEQASQSIMGGTPRGVGLHARGFRPGEDNWERHQKIEVVRSVTLAWFMTLQYRTVRQLRKS